MTIFMMLSITDSDLCSDLSVSGVDAELEGEPKQRLFISSRLKVGPQQTLRRHHVVTSRIHILFVFQNKSRQMFFTGSKTIACS